MKKYSAMKKYRSMQQELNLNQGLGKASLQEVIVS